MEAEPVFPRQAVPNAVATVTLPYDLASFLELIRQNGESAYAVMFGFAASHSLLFGLFGGYAAKAGALSFGPLVWVCWVGSFLGDVLRYWLGQRFGMRLVSGFPLLERGVTLVGKLVNKHHMWMVLLHRYPHGIRGFAAIAYGMSELKWVRFLILNFVASGIWAVVVVSAGYAFGHLSEKVMNDASSMLGFALMIGFLGLSWLLSKRLEKMAERS